MVVNDDRTRANQFEPGSPSPPTAGWTSPGTTSATVPPRRFRPPGRATSGGVSDVYYASSSDRGRTFAPNLRITDRGIDRTLGVWKMDSKFNLGIASSDDVVYFAWQDTRNAIRETDADDVYTASLRLTADAADPEPEGRSVPGWLLVGAGVAVGMGLTVVWRVRPGRPG